MRIIEPHIHTVSRTTDDYQNMALSGIVACVEPSFWSGVNRSSASSFNDYWEQVITHEPKRAAQYGIRHYAMVGINPKEAAGPVAMEALKAMEGFLDRPEVIGVGEIGLDMIRPEEEEPFRMQLRMAEERNMPVIIHTPHHNKKKGVERIIEILKEERVTEERIVMDHNTEETIELTHDKTGCWAGMTVYYVTKLSAERAVDMIERYGSGRIIVNGSADWGYSDPLAVPKVVVLMRKRGLPERDIEKIAFGNSYAFLKNSQRFDLDA